MSLQFEADSLLDYVEGLLSRGVSVDCILVDLLAPTARRLGEYWEDDRCDFVDVTMGLWRLQEIVHELGTRLPAERRSPVELRALFASMPGDQHSFGAVVVEEMFVREGWLTDRLSDATLPDLLERVAADNIDLVGLTVSCDAHAAALPMAIQALRAASRNPDVQIMVGGRAVIEDPTLVTLAGADGTASDARLAVRIAKDLVGAVRPEISACG
ncbi:MAG: B12-binding domain-containing protein [Sphingomonas sp.]